MRTILCLPLLLALPACSGAGEYPSLSPRAVEKRVAGEAGDVATPPAAANPSDPAVAARINRALEDARAARAPFRAAFDKMAPTVRKGANAPTGSEGWIQAQQALSVIDITRAPVIAALSALDEERRGIALATGISGDAALLAAAAAEVQAIDTEQTEALKPFKDALNR